MSHRRAQPARLATTVMARAVSVAGVIATPAILVLAMSVMTGPVPVSAGAPGPFELRLVDQEFEIAPGATIVIDLDLPDESGLTSVADLADTTVIVTAHGALGSRDDVDAALAGDLARQVDSVEVPGALLGPSSAADLRLVIPTEVDTRTTGALQLARPAVYPVRVTIERDNEEVAALTTFVHRLPTEDEAPERPLEVAVVAGATTPVSLDGGADVEITDAALAELEQLIALTADSLAPIAVRLPPALLDALAADEQYTDLLDRLRLALGGDDVVSGPLLPLDVSAAAAAEQSALYTQWLRDGEDALAMVADTPPTRTVTLVDRPLSAAGGALVRDLGARLLVFTPSVYAELGGPDALTVGSALVDISMTSSARVSATIIDERLAPMLADGATEPTRNAVTIAAHLLVERQALADQGIDPSRRGITLGTPDLSAPDPAVFGSLLDLLGGADGVEWVHLDTLALRADVATDTEGEPLTGGLPATVAPSISSRVTSMNSLNEEATDTASMLSDSSERPARWRELISVLPTEALTEEQVAAIAGDLFAEFAAIRGAVVLPNGFPFTLTGRSSTVPVKIGNNSTEPLTVLVSLSSPKLLFPDGPQVVTLEPGQFTEVKVRIEARSNGDTPVTLEVRTPNGGTRLGSPVPLKASVTAMSGLGNLVTGALALVLLAWWLRHVRKNRRVRGATETLGRHPVNGTRADTAAAPALSPDAEASTLPDS